jgi:hypothetical protein
MQQAFRALAREQSGIGLRVAVNTGEVVVDPTTDDLVGDPINVAARLQAAAEAVSSGAIDNRWAEAVFRAGAAVTAARLGKVDDALALVATLPPALERGLIYGNCTAIACLAAETLWLAWRTDHLATIERAVRDKVVEPDFRYPNVDGRLALARLCALSGRHDEAADWFARARTVLEEQGARPLRAIADFDEAVMYQRRGAPGDRERALALLDRAAVGSRSSG